MSFRKAAAVTGVIAVMAGLASCSANRGLRAGLDRPDGPRKGLTLKCGLLGASIGLAAAAAITFGSTALAYDEWPLREPVDWVETLPIWGSSLFFGATLGMYISCLGP